MNLVRFTTAGDEAIKTGVLEAGRITEYSGDIFEPGNSTGNVFALDQVSLATPCEPTKIVCVGLNYKDHAKESNMDLPEEPLLFLKPASSLIAAGEAIVLPETSRRVDFEAELALVIKKRATRIKAEDAGEYLLGCTCLNDVSARDFQVKDGQWTRAKGFDTFCPLGPAITTDIDPSNLSIEAFLNGEKKQSSNTSNLIFGVNHIIAHISSIMTLEKGDVIATGTPAGVGQLKSGDEIEVRISGLEPLKNPVK